MGGRLLNQKKFYKHPFINIPLDTKKLYFEVLLFTLRDIGGITLKREWHLKRILFSLCGTDMIDINESAKNTEKFSVLKYQNFIDIFSNKWMGKIFIVELLILLFIDKDTNKKVGSISLVASSLKLDQKDLNECIKCARGLLNSQVKTNIKMLHYIGYIYDLDSSWDIIVDNIRLDQDLQLSNNTLIINSRVEGSDKVNLSLSSKKIKIINSKLIGVKLTIKDSDLIDIRKSFIKGSRGNSSKISIENSKNISIDKSIFSNNQTSPLSIKNSDFIKIESSLFMDNSFKNSKGSIEISKGNNIKINKSIFKSNLSTSIYSGGIYVDSSNYLNLASNLISFNRVTSKYSSGSGIYLKDIKEVTLKNNKITNNTTTVTSTNNTSSANGGGLYMEGCINIDISCNHILKNICNMSPAKDSTYYSSTSYSSAAGGGGYFIKNINLNIKGNFIENNSTNSSYSYGGGLYFLENKDTLFKGNTVINNSANSNTATSNGGGIYIRENYNNTYEILKENYINNNSSKNGTNIWKYIN